MTDEIKSTGVVSSAVLAQLFDVDERTIRDLAVKGMVVRAGRGQFVVSQSIRNYVRHLRQVAAGRGGDERQASLAFERARLAREQADFAALRNAERRGELLDAKAVEEKWDEACTTVRNGMMALISSLPMALPHLTRADIDVIDREIRNALHTTADQLDGEK